MTITTTGTYEGATYYDCRDSERLSCETEDEAIEEFIDLQLEPRMTPAEVEAKIREIDSVEVAAHFRQEWDESEIQDWAEYAAERVNDSVSENYGDPDGDPVFDEKELKAAFAEALRKVKPQLWMCERMGSRTYEGDDLVAKVREICPEWFEDKAS